MKNSPSRHWMAVTKWILIISLLAGLGLCYVLCKNQVLHLAEERGRLKHQLDEIEARNDVLAGDLQGMKSMASLQRRLRTMHSSLVPLGDPRAVWLSWEQNTRARVAPFGTRPNAGLNLDSVPVAANVSAPPVAH